MNGVTQAPVSAYTVSGSTIVFASALTSNDVIDYIIAFEGPKMNVDASNIGAGEITTSMIADNAITSDKIGVDVIVAEDLAANSITVSELTDGAITEAKLNIDNSPTNDHVLTAKSSAAGGLTWAAAAAGIAGITSSADGTAMTIDSSERIVMPYQPMFHGCSISAVSGGSLALVGASPGFQYRYTDTAVTSNAQAMSFGKIWLNIGSHWSNTTGQFTCPIAGRYLAYWNNNYHQASNWPNAQMMHSVNGGAHYRVAQSWQSTAQNTDQYNPLVAFCIIEAAANDKIWPSFHSGYDDPLTSTNYGYHTCVIMLIG